MSQSARRFERAQNLSDLAATIVTATDGGSIRTISAISLRRPNGRFPSRKAMRTMPYDAMHERDLLWISEADPAVVTFLSQPHRLELNVRGRDRPLIYFPDVRRDMEDGTIEIVETKKSASEVTADPAYEQKIALARQVYSMLGWRFRILDWPTIKHGPTLSNARMIAGSRHVRLGTKDRMLVLFLLQNGPLPYCDLISGMSESGNPFDIVAREKLHASIVHRIARLDISRAIMPSTPVSLGPAATVN